MEMLDKFILNILGKIDDAVAKVEDYAIKLVEWCWQSRVNILNKKSPQQLNFIIQNSYFRFIMLKCPLPISTKIPKKTDYNCNYLS